MKKEFLFLSALLVLLGCQPKKSDLNTTAEATKPYLIIYYSQTGVTEKVAAELSERLPADMVRFDVEQPYNGTYEETIERCRKEMESGRLSDIAPLDIDISQYDTIFLGYPIWFGTYAHPIVSLLQTVDFEGKTIVPFCTFGSGGLGASSQDLKKALPKAHILQGYGVRTARVDKCSEEIERFLIEQGYLKGTIEPLPAYGELHPVTADEVAIFHAACSDYKYPLGKPVKVAKRSTDKQDDYQFVSETDNNALFTIFVVVGKEENATPEFTEVVR